MCSRIARPADPAPLVGVVVACALVAAGCIAVRSENHRSRAKQPTPMPSPLTQTTAQPRPPEAPRTVYGPPAPVPVYGPPAPPSRDPLFGSGGNRGFGPVLDLQQDVVRPTGPRAPAAGSWAGLVTRGLPFANRLPVGQATRVGDSGGLRIVYVIDLDLGRPHRPVLSAVAAAVKASVRSLGKEDQFAVLDTASSSSSSVSLESASAPEATRRALDRLDALKPDRPSDWPAALVSALAAQDVKQVIGLIAAGGRDTDDPGQLRALIRRANAACAKLLLIAIGREASPLRSAALRGIAADSAGAYAWLASPTEVVEAPPIPGDPVAEPAGDAALR